jgi:hypothetical protein
VRHSPCGAFDLHVLGMPPAFVLSQDQTLRFEPIFLRPLARTTAKDLPNGAVKNDHPICKTEVPQKAKMNLAYSLSSDQTGVQPENSKIDMDTYRRPVNSLNQADYLS